MSDPRPAWSDVFVRGALRLLAPIAPLEAITREWAWGGSTGRGVRVAVIDSGIEADHPAVGGGIVRYAAIGEGPDGPTVDESPHGDDFGHGTACAGIIRRVAPECELYSVKVLGGQLSGRGTAFAAGLRWAIEQGAQVCNLSLGTTKKEFYGVLHELADRAYFRNVMLVAAANNLPIPSYPSIYASVISVAATVDGPPDVFWYNPRPPVEFGAPGIDVRVAWRDGGWITTTGNSFAAPHITGMVARILAKHPDLAPFQMKAVLRELAANVSREPPPVVPPATPPDTPPDAASTDTPG